MQSKAETVAEYLKSLPEERRAAITKVRSVIRKNLPKGLQESMCYGMISYFVPLKAYPPGYHCDPEQGLPFAALASQKNYMSLYLMTAYQSGKVESWIRDQFQASGKKLDMGKCCIRFKKLEDLPLDVIGEAIGMVSMGDYIVSYEDARKLAASRRKIKTRA
jgi:hypothetical protein